MSCSQGSLYYSPNVHSPFFFCPPTSSHPLHLAGCLCLFVPVCLLAPSFSPARHPFSPQSLLLSPYLPTPLFDFSGPRLSLASSLCFLSIRLVSPTVASVSVCFSYCLVWLTCASSALRPPTSYCLLDQNSPSFSQLLEIPYRTRAERPRSAPAIGQLW